MASTASNDNDHSGLAPLEANSASSRTSKAKRSRVGLNLFWRTFFLLAILLTYLTLVEGMGLEEATTLLVRARPEVCPTWEAYHGCRQDLTARYEERIRQRAGELGQGSALPKQEAWRQAERAIWREVLTAE